VSSLNDNLAQFDKKCKVLKIAYLKALRGIRALK
jgi:hypothetical protein